MARLFLKLVTLLSVALFIYISIFHGLNIGKIGIFNSLHSRLQFSNNTSEDFNNTRSIGDVFRSSKTKLLFSTQILEKIVINNTETEFKPQTTKDNDVKNIKNKEILLTSKTRPKFYPFNGTGTTVDISAKYDFDVFNVFCKVNWTMVAVLPVYSAPGNFERRRAIRETVGKECKLIKCRLFFIIGISHNDSLNSVVKKEYYAEKDILIINKIDTYRDLNNKVVAMLDWLIQYCPEPKYVIHIIDDTYPNLRYFMEHLEAMKGNRFMIGLVSYKATPFRGHDNKWYISFEEYPYTKYPPYIVGIAYAFLNSDSQLLRDYVHAVEYCWVEDVWFTGMVAKGANFSFTPFTKKHAEYISDITHGILKSYSCIHNVSAKQFYKIYNATLTSDDE